MYQSHLPCLVLWPAYSLVHVSLMCMYICTLTCVYLGMCIFKLRRLDEFQQFYDIQGLSWSRVRMYVQSHDNVKVFIHKYCM